MKYITSLKRTYMTCGRMCSRAMHKVLLTLRHVILESSKYPQNRDQIDIYKDTKM